MKTGDVILHLRLPSGLAPGLGQTASKQGRRLIKITPAKKISVLVSRTALAGGGFQPARRFTIGGLGKNLKQAASSVRKRSAKAKSRSRRIFTATALKPRRHRQVKRKKSGVVLAKTGLGGTQATTVGIWDLGAWTGRLPSLLKSMNKVQGTYRFFVVEATVPVGIIRKKQAVIKWVERQSASRLKSRQRREAGENIVADDFFSIAHAVRKDLGIDYLAGVTPSMIADDEDDEVSWNLFSTFEGRCVLASSYDLRSFAQQSRRPFEVFLGGIILAQLLAAQYSTRGLEFHDEQRYCLFDFNEDRQSLVQTARRIQIDAECLKKIAPKSRDAAVALVKLLRRFR